MSESPSLLRRLAERFGVDPSKLMATLKATAFRVKEGQVSDEQMMALLIVADQYKLNPFTKEIYAYPDKQGGIVPVVSIDGWTRIVNEHPQFDGVEFEYGPAVAAGTLRGQKLPAHEWVAAKIYRKDRGHPISLTEHLDEVYRPPFQGKGKDGKPYEIDGPWQSHTKRLHRHKAWIQCARLAFGFAGIYDDDEAQRIVEVTSNGEVVERKSLTGQVRRKTSALPATIDDPIEIHHEVDTRETIGAQMKRERMQDEAAAGAHDDDEAIVSTRDANQFSDLLVMVDDCESLAMFEALCVEDRPWLNETQEKTFWLAIARRRAQFEE